MKATQAVIVAASALLTCPLVPAVAGNIVTNFMSRPTASTNSGSPEVLGTIAEELNEANELWLKGNAAEGIPRYERALVRIGAVFGTNSPQSGLVLFRIGFLYTTQGKFEIALPILERSRELIRNLPDDDQNRLTKANLEWGLGISYQALLRYEKAIHAFQQSLQLKEELFGADSYKLAEPLSRMSDLYYAHHRPAEALPLLQRLLAITEKFFGPESAEVAQVLASLGNTWGEARQVDRAERCLNRSLEIREKLPGIGNAALAASLCNLGSFYSRLGDYAQGTHLLKRGIDLLEKDHSSKDILSAFQLASALGNLGLAEVRSGDFYNGISNLKRSIEITETNWGAGSINLVSALNTLAVAYRCEGDYQSAAPLLDRALRIVEGAPPVKKPEFVDTLNNLAELMRDAGDETNATRLFKRSSELAQSQFGPDYVSLAYSLNGLALIYQNRGDFSGALRCFRRSCGILEKNYGDSHPDLAGVLNNIAALLDKTGDTNRALATFQRALAIQERVLPGGHPATATTLNNLAVIFRGRGQLAEARDLSSRSLAITEAVLGKNSPESCARLENLGIVEILCGDQAKGFGEFAESARRWRRYLAGQMTSRQGPGPPRIQERIRISREWFHSLSGAAPRDLFRMAWSSGAEKLAFSKALLEEVETMGANLAADGRARIREMRQQAAYKRRQLEALARPDGGAAWAAERMAWRSSERDRLEQELSEIEKTIASEVELVASIVREGDFSLADVARNLPPGSALADFVQYRRTDFSAGDGQWKEQRYAVYLTLPATDHSTDLVVERVDLGVATPINEAVEFICSRMSEGRGYAAPDMLAAVQKVSELVYAPLARYLTNVSRLIVCPDGQLSRLPFETLSHEGRFLIEDKTISYVGSGREIVRLAGGPKSKVQSSKSFVMGNPDFDLDLSGPGAAGDLARKSEINAGLPKLSGPGLAITLSRDYRGRKFLPLPGAEAEARSVAKLLGADTVLKVGADAREAALKAVVSPRVLHLATHGFFLSDQEFRRTNGIYDGFIADGGLAGWRTRPGEDWENPLVRCGIALAGANHASQLTNAVAEDGLLTGLEASLLNLQGTELVILSACNSGAGEVRIGEGVMSLRRAFRIAGAETVLASHWKVNDTATRLLMTEFIRRWRSGESRAEAWRRAQLSLLHSKDFSNPYFWASFTLTGQWR